MTAVSPPPQASLPANYKWIVLSNTTIGIGPQLLETLPHAQAAAWASWLRGGKYHYREEPEVAVGEPAIPDAVASASASASADDGARRGALARR